LFVGFPDYSYSHPEEKVKKELKIFFWLQLLMHCLYLIGICFVINAEFEGEEEVQLFPLRKIEKLFLKILLMLCSLLLCKKLLKLHAR